MSDLIIIVGAYLIGSIPVAWIAGRVTTGIDIREYGSGNVGASNVWHSVSHSLVVPVGLMQVAQGMAGPLLARALDAGTATEVAAGVAAIIANGWNPWLRFSGGRGIGQAIGFLLVLSPAALIAFIAISLAGVALRAIPQFVALAILAAPVAAAAAGQEAAVVAGCAVVAALILLKRLLANGPPEAALQRPDVWLYRLVYDRDIQDREAWVRRGLRAPPER